MIDRENLTRYSINQRHHLVDSSDFASLPRDFSAWAQVMASLPKILKGAEFTQLCGELGEIVQAGGGLMLGMGGHVIKCGLGPVIIRLMEAGIIKAVALNGSTAIHDFEVAMIGKTSEDVAGVLSSGEFGMSLETGREMNLAAGRARDTGIGFGQALGETILGGEYPWRHLSVLARAAELGIPATVHVALGTDIIHMHPECDGAALGAATYRDFLLFTETVQAMADPLEIRDSSGQVRQIPGGAYLNFGSAVLLPEVFLKALSMVNNLRKGGEACLITANFDMIQHYRPMTNVVKRPSAGSGRGYSFTMHHEFSLPLLAGCLLQEKQSADPCDQATAGRGLIQDFEQVRALCAKYRAQGRKIVFTNGCFDILHAGHVDYLQRARDLGDLLIIGLNSDQSVSRLKGPTRPVNGQEDRALVLLGLKSVDHVALFTQDTPLLLIQAVEPDVLVKGGDWGRGHIVGEDLVTARGGQVLSIPLLEGRSSSAVIQKMAEESADQASDESDRSNDSNSGTDAPDVVGVIPARWGSTRFPGKPLVDLCGKPVLQRVWERAAQCRTISRLLIATDDPRIHEAALSWGAQCVMTSSDHPTGSDRIAEVVNRWGGDIIVNIQGDEPFLDPEQVDRAVQALIDDDQAQVATLVTPFGPNEDPREVSRVKVAVSRRGHALYFSRAPIPYPRDTGTQGGRFLKHIGLYVYRASALKEFSADTPAPVEEIEKLEQLRILDRGGRILALETDRTPIGIDTPADLEEARRLFAQQTGQ